MTGKTSQNYSKLQADWENDTNLSYLACDSVEDLAAHLRKCHKTLMSGRGGPYGYLYQQQVKKNRQLKEELKNERIKQTGQTS